MGRKKSSVMGNAGILEQIQEYEKQYYRSVTLDEVDNFLNELSKQNKMSKRYNNKKKMEQAVMTDEQIKAVMDLYKPNFIQKFYMKYFSPIETTNVLRNTSIAVLVGLLAVGIVFKSPIEVVVAGFLGAVLAAGDIYSVITNRQRITQLCSVLNQTPEQVTLLEKKFYL